MSNSHLTKPATKEDVLNWLVSGIFRVEDGRVFKGNTELTQRINKRRGSERGDPRVDLWHKGKRRSMNVSTLVWMQHTGMGVMTGFEIHHLDEDPLNNGWSNLICLHSLDHQKMHYETDEVPF